MVPELVAFWYYKASSDLCFVDISDVLRAQPSYTTTPRACHFHVRNYTMIFFVSVHCVSMVKACHRTQVDSWVVMFCVSLCS